MREIVLDTETTGLDPLNGHRLVEIGCIELVNHVATGRTYHQYINPERDMPEEAFRVHQLSEEFLVDFPLFADVADAFLEFIGDATLIIHNAEFDMGFINAELARLKRPSVPMERSVDTVRMARKKFPGSPANLDALCKRFGIDNSHRELHGALIDADLLAGVYLELIGGRQPDLELSADAASSVGDPSSTVQAPKKARAARTFQVNPDEATRHAAFLEKLKEPIWSKEPA